MGNSGKVFKKWFFPFVFMREKHIPGPGIQIKAKRVCFLFLNFSPTMGGISFFLCPPPPPPSRLFMYSDAAVCVSPSLL